MVQRIQTLYLLLVIVCGVLLAVFPPVTFLTSSLENEQHLYEMTFTGIQDISVGEVPVTVMNTVSLSIIAIIIPLLALVDIFLFRKRILQARLNVVNILLCVGYYAILAVYIWFAKMNLYVDWHLTVWAGLPLVSIVLLFMAIRAILRDEALVRAADRLR